MVYYAVDVKKFFIFFPVAFSTDKFCKSGCNFGIKLFIDDFDRKTTDKLI